MVSEMGADALTPDEIIGVLGLKPHPEGGSYRETYRSRVAVTVTNRDDASGQRCASTAILYILKEGEMSRLHRIVTDEIWHYHLGGPFQLSMIHPDGRVEEVVLGPGMESGQAVYCMVPAGCWFGGVPLPGSSYTLLGCTVAPGFEFRDLTIGERKDLLNRYPGASKVIARLTAA